MRKPFTGSLVALALLIGIPSAAQAQCLLCGVVGFMLGSSTSTHASPQEVSGNGGAVLYVAPRISERISDPLGVHIVSSSHGGFSTGDWTYKFKGMTIQQIFEKTVDKPDQYVILEVMRVISPSSINTAVLWFAYLEKEKVTSLDKLPPPAQK